MDAREYLFKLIRFRTDSTTGQNYEECAEFMASELKKVGFDVEIIYGNADDDRPRPNVIAQRGKKPFLLYSAHFDVVPPGEGWDTDPWTPIERDGRIYGRGSSDDKSAIAVALASFSQGNSLGNIKVIFACDEEVGGLHGLHSVVKKRREWFSDIELAWVPDVGTNAIYIGASGVLGGTITVDGIGGHAGYPHLAQNPVPKLARLITELNEYERICSANLSKVPSPPNSPTPYVWKRFSVTMLSGSPKTNIIPPKASAGFDLRLLPEETLEEGKQQFLKFFYSTAKRLNIDAKIEFLYGHPGYAEEVTPVIERFRDNVERVFGPVPYAGELGGNDGSFIHELGIPTVGFGFIEPCSRFHQANEFIRVEMLEKAAKLAEVVFQR